jgi:DNA/RNA endonuclease G (NUC1)
MSLRPAALVLLFLTALTARATIGTSLQAQLGNPSNATTDPASRTNYLLPRPQYWLGYNDATREPNWVAWNLTAGDTGSAGRSPDFFVDPDLPAGFTPVLTTAYSGSGYDRGHMCPSADRTVSRADNDVTFYMSNMVPQAPDNNQGVWASFETYSRTLAAAGNELLIISGPSGFASSTLASGVAIPGYTWKIAVVVPLGPGTALSRINASTRVIALKMPNIAGIRNNPWQQYVTSAAQLEADTGFTFFTALAPAIAAALRSQVDGQTAAGSPVITAQPASQTTFAGGSATFSVTATGDEPLVYQWFKDDAPLAGAVSATLTIANAQAGDIGVYNVVVTNAIGSQTSADAALVITGLPPVITAPPAPLTAAAGSNVTFSVGVTGSPTLGFQWYKGPAPLPGATTATLNLANVQAGDTGSYSVVVTNSVGTATSAPATLTVTPAGPVITGQPAPLTVTTGANAAFTVTASGTAPLTYQWRKNTLPLGNGGAVAGADTATLVLTGVSAVDAGSYDVVVTNSVSTATSAAANLTVNAPAPSSITWNFGTAAATADPTGGLPPDLTGGTLSQGNNNGTTTLLTTTSASSSYTGASGSFNAGAAARIGALNQGAGGSAYFEFTLAPAAGKRLAVSGIAFGMRSTSTGPQAFGVYTSLDGFSSAVATGTVPNNSAWVRYTPAFTAVTGPTGAAVTFRIYGYNGTGSPGAGTANWRMDDLALTASAVFPPPVAPAVIGTVPAAGATGVASVTPIAITFNEAVSFTGSWFAITSAAQGPLAATVTGGPTTFLLTPPGGFAYSDTITVTIFGAQVVDQASGSIPGAGNTTFSFATAAFVPPTPPAIATPPLPQTVNAGGTASFSITATGTAPLSYQWRRNGVPVAGNASATTPTLTLTGVAPADAGAYDCVVSNVAGNAVSPAAALTVLIVPPAIVAPPVAQLVPLGGTAAFAVTASGTAPLQYQWRKDGVPLPGATLPALSLAGAGPADNAAYDVVVSNSAGSATSAAATLAVTAGAPAVIYWDFATATPTSGLPDGVTGGTLGQGNNNGTTALLTAVSVSSGYTGASGSNNAGAAARIGPLNRADGGSAFFEFSLAPDAGFQLAVSAISFGTRSTGTGPQAYTIYSSADGFSQPVAAGTVPNNSAWTLQSPDFRGANGAAGAPLTFRVYGHNGAGSPGTGTANWRIDDLKVTAGLLARPPAIVTPPVAQAATVGDTVTFSVTATGSAPLAYQWRKNTVPLAGNPSALTPVLTLAGVLTTDAGSYDCVVTNPAGTVTSAAASLAVAPAPATVALAGLTYTYDGSARAATVTTTPAGLAVVVTYAGAAAPPVNAGSYEVIATISDPNYFGSATATLVIGRAPASVVLGDLAQTYTGAPRIAGVTTTPAGLAVETTYAGSTAAPVNAGSYAVVATVTDANYTGSAAATLVVAKAPALIALGNLVQSYTGTPRSVSASTTPAGLPVTLTYDGAGAAPTNVGSYSVLAAVSHPNYAGAASGTLQITAATGTVALGNLSQSYDGLPKPVSVTTIPAGLPVAVTYNGGSTAPTYPGSYAVTATITNPNYAGSASGTLDLTITALVRRAPSLNAGLDGSVQVLTGENLTLNGNAWVSGDILLPGTPTIRLNGQPTLAGAVDATGGVSPSNYQVTLSGNALVRYVVRRIDPIALPVVAAPPAPAGTRNVSLNSADGTPGDFATLRNLTLNGNAGAVAVPPGTYGTLTANGNSSFVLGVAGSTTAAVYHLQGLTLNANTRLTVVGPVVVNLASGTSLNGDTGVAGHADWLRINVANGGVTLNGNIDVRAHVVAPSGSVVINGNSTLTGSVIADRLTLNGNAELRSDEP